MQLVDELSMIYTTCLMCYATFSYSKSYRHRMILGLGLTGLSVFITLYYHYLQDPRFHQNAYAILTIVVLLRSMWLMETNLRPSRRRQQNQTQNDPSSSLLGTGRDDQQHFKDQRDLYILNDMWMMVAYGLITFLGGFLIWNLDNAYCPKLRGWRQHVGLPWGIFLEGHGWW